MGEELKNFLLSRKKMNLLMIIINLAVYVILEMMGSTEDLVFMLKHGAMFAPALKYGGVKECYRLFTSMFLHFGAEHLAYNMLLLLFAGDLLEQKVGPIRYLIIYLGGGLVGNLFSFALAAQDTAVSAGASGAVFAVIGALVCIVLKHKGNAPGINGRGLLLMAIFSLLEFKEGVDNVAHLGGALGGFLLTLLLYHVKRYHWSQSADEE